MNSMSQAKQIKILWIAVLVLGASLFGLIGYMASNANQVDEEAIATLQPPLETQINPWSDLSLSEKLHRSSAVVIADLRSTNGRLQAIATDVLILTPGTEIRYREGQEVQSLSRSAGGTTDWGDGAVALLTGSPASVQESYSVHAGRIPGLGDMPIEEFKRLATTR